MFKKTILFFSAIILTGCSNESTSDLIDDTPIDNVTYNENVRSIINNNCIVCHGTVPANGAPMSLTTYENVVDAVTNRELIDRISREQGQEGMMPLGGQRLPDHVINIIVQWQAQGLQE